ncbi:MAG TPA: hypothetical protein VJ754_00615 [Anaerolineae bacterium]|nr:hypothetical protein [Anaerolineae bacterium]
MENPHPTSTRSLERFFALTAAAVCLVISARIWQVLSGQQPMWPLPGLYLLEILVASAIGMFGILRSDSEWSAPGGGLTWAAIGVLLAFAVMGAWSVGLLYSPVVVILVITAVLSDRRRNQNMLVHWGIGLIAALAQVALMLAVIRLLYPDAIF